MERRQKALMSPSVREKKRRSKKICRHYRFMLIIMRLSQSVYLVESLGFSSLRQVYAKSSTDWRESGVGGKDMILHFLSHDTSL